METHNRGDVPLPVWASSWPGADEYRTTGPDGTVWLLERATDGWSLHPEGESERSTPITNEGGLYLALDLAGAAVMNPAS